MRVCIIGASGKPGRYMVSHAPVRDDEVVGVCCEQSVGKLGAYRGRSGRVRTTCDPTSA